MAIQFNNLLPLWLTLPLVLALLAAIGYGTFTLARKQVARNWLVTLTSLRLGIFVLFVLILVQPAVTYTSSVRQLPELIVLVDASHGMGQAGENRTRLDEVKTALRQGEFAAALKERYQVHWFALEQSAKPIRESDLATLKPGDGAAQFADAIDAASTQVRALSKQPQRVLLVSDGRDGGQADPVESARRLGLAVDVLAPTGIAAEPPAVVIAEVQSARRVLLGSDTIFRVTLDGKAPASKDRPVTIRVEEGGKKVIEHPVVLKAGRIEQSVELSHRPGSVGLKHYEFHADTSSKPYPLTVQVLDNKYEVLILEDRWRWDYKYLHRLFEDDPSFRFSALLSRGGGAFVQFGSPDRRVNLVGFPQSRADLEGFDTFVLGDINPTRWPRGLASDLARLVADDGRSLVVVAGPSLGSLLEIPDLESILPVELTADSGKPIDGPIDVRLRADAAASPFFFQLGDRDEKLTPVDQIYPVVRKRPGATVLVEAVKERNAYGNRIVLAEHTVGRGRVLFVGTDTLWKWHTLAAANDGPTPYSIFWQQAFRAMAPARSAPGAVNVWLTPSRSRAAVGRVVLIEAEIATSRSLPPASFEASVTGPDDKKLPLMFNVDPANPKLYRATFTSTTPGVQRITATLVGDGKVLAEAMTTIQAEVPTGESGEIDLANLARIAHNTGGRVIDPSVAQTWPTPMDEPLPNVARLHTIDPWSNFTLLLLLCVLLGADWFIRLFKGMVSG